MTKKLVRVSSLWITCSFSTNSILYPAWAAILITEGRSDSKTLKPKSGPPLRRISLAGLRMRGSVFRHINPFLQSGATRSR